VDATRRATLMRRVGEVAAVVLVAVTVSRIKRRPV